MNPDYAVQKLDSHSWRELKKVVKYRASVLDSGYLALFIKFWKLTSEISGIISIFVCTGGPPGIGSQCTGSCGLLPRPLPVECCPHCVILIHTLTRINGTGAKLAGSMRGLLQYKLKPDVALFLRSSYLCIPKWKVLYYIVLRCQILGKNK
jgi:hypothetical protein